MDTHDPLVTRRWVRVAAFCGLYACIAYPVMVFVPMPLALQLIIGGMFGPALGIASVGLLYLLRLYRPTVMGQVAAISNVLAGALVTAMIVVQLAVRSSADMYMEAHGNEGGVRLIVDRVWDVILGLDVAFDIYIGLGTLLFGLAMLRHPRFGKLVGGVGIFLAVVMTLGANFYSFPQPPKDVGLIDPGPLNGLWYLWVVILSFLSFGWVDRQLGLRADQAVT
jgi:hypothetical protein